ncbi:hypothetical protein BOTBODRAFT_49484 [Botryobasidium botryosum FD-172 SS1]|uniref:Uncharacterized protein n=1 Tax=Botryobasidium botryosum (strain FD-172 SS1) TaxID=930990 RepID=A0A067LVF6_BOTB1|nr:hypothetical protein BOTBODRAFT_49484 [Botryobasidium botryosum FD-172 SS1]
MSPSIRSTDELPTHTRNHFQVIITPPRCYAVPHGERKNYSITCQSNATKVVNYPRGAIVSYPKTLSGDEKIVHIFDVDPMLCRMPPEGFACSFGEPKGQHPSVPCKILKATDVGKSDDEGVMCRKIHWTLFLSNYKAVGGNVGFEYFWALWDDNEEELQRMVLAANIAGYDPRAPSADHRLPNGAYALMSGFVLPKNRGCTLRRSYASNTASGRHTRTNRGAHLQPFEGCNHTTIYEIFERRRQAAGALTRRL